MSQHALEQCEALSNVNGDPVERIPELSQDLGGLERHWHGTLTERVQDVICWHVHPPTLSFICCATQRVNMHAAATLLPRQELLHSCVVVGLYV